MVGGGAVAMNHVWSRPHDGHSWLGSSEQMQVVAVMGFFPTTTKQTRHVAETDLLSWWQSLFEIPCVAIGGITPENCAPLIAAGADFLAVSHAVWGGDEAAAVRAFAEVMGG